MLSLSGGAPATPLPTITVLTPASQASDAPYTVVVAGTYGNGGAGAIHASLSTDAGTTWSGWATLVASPAGGAYSGSVTFSAGGMQCRVRVRQVSHTGVIAVTSDFALLAAPPVDGGLLLDTAGEQLTDTNSEPLIEAA